MFKNRFLIVLGVLSLLLVAMVISFPLSNRPTSAEPGRADDVTRWTAMGEYYRNQSRQEYLMDSATRSYIAQAKAVACGVEAAHGLDSATRSYIAWARSLETGTSCQ